MTYKVWDRYFFQKSLENIFEAYYIYVDIESPYIHDVENVDNVSLPIGQTYSRKLLIFTMKWKL